MITSALLVFHALGYQHSYIDIAFLFMLTNIASVLPLSVNGVGFREYIFLTALPLINVETEIGIAFSAVFFALFALSSFIALFFRQN